MFRRTLVLVAALSLSFAAFAPAASADDADRNERNSAVPDHVSELMLRSPVTASDVLDIELFDATGEQTVLVRLVGDSVAESDAATPAARRARRAAVEAEQDAFVTRARRVAPGADVVASTQTVLNGVFLRADAAQIRELADDPAVLRISRVVNYEMDLPETVPYIGASAVQNRYDGTGITVAVLDSGIDYTHLALGGSGDPAEYAANNPDIIEAGTFPSAKVVAGYDFVGSVWPNAPEAPDPDPLDDGPQAGHGTHVGHIIGGVGGVAPGVDLYAVKVCSSVSTSCSGIALIQGMDFAIDPNGDGDTSDAVDVINMSLGSDYGVAFDDDLSQAVDNASAIGVLTVSSAGNGADKPFISGTPSSASTALAVAQTHVPSATLQFLTVDGVDYQALFQDWSVPLTEVITGPVQYADGAGGNLDGCAPFTTDLSGLIVLVDRGACNFTLKISNISQAGGEAGIIGLIAPGAPFTGGDGGDRPIDIPGYMIGQADSNAIKAQIGGPGLGTLDPANGLPLVGQMVGSSSRGPANGDHILKPEIGAPGASVSAIAGSGTGEGPFGGTSGASPMVAGSAALLLQAEPGLSPAEVKARLVGTAESNIDTDPFAGLAPVSRIGGGEVRVDRAVEATLAAWDPDNLLPSMSFGHVDVADETVTLQRQLLVHNYSNRRTSVALTPTFRFSDDASSGAVRVSISPSSAHVEPNGSAVVDVTMTIRGDLLPGNFMNSGSEGANGDALTANEFDGYIDISGRNGEYVHVPWHVLPRQAADVAASPQTLRRFDGHGFASVTLDNTGVGVAQNDSFSLLDVSPNLPEGGPGEQSPVPDLRAIGVNTFPVPADFCSAEESFIWAFASNTWERQTLAVAAPSYVQWDLDTDQDGAVDYEVFNFDLSLSSGLSDGRNVTWVADSVTGDATAFFFTEQSTVTGNMVQYICGEQIGLTGTDMLATNVDVLSVTAVDWYFGGAGDTMGPYTITPLGEQFFGQPVDIAANDSATIDVLNFGRFPGNTPELGIMLFTNGDRGFGAYGGAVEHSEMIALPTRANARYVRTVLGG